MPVDRLRFSEDARNRLITLRTRTRLPTYAVLARLALCLSLNEDTIPPATPPRADSTLEIDWSTFAGPIGDELWAMLRLRCHQDGLPLDEEALATQLAVHVHRGIGYLIGQPDLKTIADLAALLHHAATAADTDARQARRRRSHGAPIHTGQEEEQ